MKRIITIQDISCVGKCSLTVALPVISAMGVEASVIPTAVLSCHTAFPDFTFHDLTDEIQPVSQMLRSQGLTFDAIYTGYLGSVRQINLMEQLFKDFKTDSNIIIVDPAMADYGKLYKGFTQSFADRMAQLCGQADVIVPNLTEACYMLKIPYIGENYTKQDIQNILTGLSDLGCDYCVLTGISFDDSKLGAMAYDKKIGQFFECYSKKFPKSFHGTGDIFASTFTGALMQNNVTKEDALQIAVDFTADCIEATLKNNDYNWYGVDFETAIPKLIERIKKYK